VLAAALWARGRGGRGAEVQAILTVLAILLLASGAPLVHGASRLHAAAALTLLTVAHQAGATTWAGGLVHLVAQRLGGRGDAGWARAWPDLLARFSPLAIASVSLLVATGAALVWPYVGTVGALVGTPYGVMILSKAALLAAALLLARTSYLAARAWRLRGDRSAADARVPPRLEAEMGAVLAALLAAAALTSQPPAADVRERPSPREVAAAFAPKRPQLVPPPHAAMVAGAAASLDPYATPGALDRVQSNFNHNVAGLLLLLAAAAAFAGRRAGAGVGRHWPLALLPLGLFVLALAEPNGWPFGTEGFFETLLAPSVLVHRAATALVLALALLEWRVQAGSLGATRWRFLFPLLCAAGGALLLTHSHALLPSRWAFLTEITHDAIGLLAVFMGVARWLELRRGDGRRSLAWPACMALIGLVLVFYRET